MFSCVGTPSFRIDVNSVSREIDGTEFVLSGADDRGHVQLIAGSLPAEAKELPPPPVLAVPNAVGGNKDKSWDGVLMSSQTCFILQHKGSNQAIADQKPFPLSEVEAIADQLAGAEKHLPKLENTEMRPRFPVCMSISGCGFMSSAHAFAV